MWCRALLDLDVDNGAGRMAGNGETVSNSMIMPRDMEIVELI